MKYFLSAFIISCFTFASFAEENKTPYLLKHYRNFIKGFYSPAPTSAPVPVNTASLAESVVLINTIIKNTNKSKEKKVSAYEQVGSGFFIRPNLLVTNLHVIILEKKLSPPEKIRFRHKEGEWQTIKKIKFLSLSMDLAFLETESPGVPLELVDPIDEIQNDSLVYTMGFLDKKMVKRTWNLMKIIDEDILLSPLFLEVQFNGLSGSPLLNKQGKVVGVLYKGGYSLTPLDKKEERSYLIANGGAIKASDLKVLLQQALMSELSFSEIKQLFQSEISVLEDKANWIWDKETQAQAQFTLGAAYLAGNGVKENLQKNIKFWHSSAQSEYLSALMELGRMYHNRISLQLLRFSEENSPIKGEQSLTEEQYQLVEENKLKAYHLWKKAALKGHPVAQYFLGTLYNNPSSNNPFFTETPSTYTHEYKGNNDIKDPMDWIKLSVAQGYPNAQLYLGHSYLYGFGVPKDPMQAKILWEKLAEKGHIEAQYLLGLLYVNYAKELKLTKRKAFKRADYWINKAKSQIPEEFKTQRKKEPRCQNIFKKLLNK